MFTGDAPRNLREISVAAALDQDEALVMFDRIAVFNNGNIEQVGSARDHYERPDTAFVAQFLSGSSVIPCTAWRGESDGGIQTATGNLLASRGDVPSDGDAVLVVRSECLKVLPAAGLRPEGNVLRGRIRQEIYLGNSRKLQIALESGVIAFSREAAGANSETRTGDKVWLTFDTADTVVFAAANDRLTGDDADIEST